MILAYNLRYGGNTYRGVLCIRAQEHCTMKKVGNNNFKLSVNNEGNEGPSQHTFLGM